MIMYYLIDEFLHKNLWKVQTKLRCPCPRLACRVTTGSLTSSAVTGGSTARPEPCQTLNRRYSQTRIYYIISIFHTFHSLYILSDSSALSTKSNDFFYWKFEKYFIDLQMDSKKVKLNYKKYWRPNRKF